MGAGQNKWIGWLVLGLIFCGWFLRINRYLCNFSFWGDEAWVAWDVGMRSLPEILGNGRLDPSLPLPPIGFLVVEKVLVMLWGPQEMVFRFFPCFCGVASVCLLVRLLKRLVSPRVMWIALAFFVFSNLLIYYSSELKQYSSDVCIVIALYLVHGQAVKKGLSDGSLAFLAVSGWIGLLIAPVVGVVMLCLAVLQIFIYFRRQARELMWKYCRVLGLWCVIALGVWFAYYRLSYSPDIREYYRPYCLSWPGLGGEWGIWWQKLLAVFQSPVELTWAWLAALMFLVGCWSLWRTNRERLFLWGAPIAITAVLSLWEQYPFAGRFVVFLLPLFFILIAQGVDAVMDGGRWRRILGLVIVAALLAQPVANARHYFVPAADADVRSLMLYIRDHAGPQDALYLNNETQWGALFYSSLYVFPDGVIPVGIINEHFVGEDGGGRYFYVLSPDRRRWKKVYGWDRLLAPAGVGQGLPRTGRTWILLSQVTPEKERLFLSSFDAAGSRLLKRRSRNAVLYLYDLQ